MVTPWAQKAPKSGAFESGGEAALIQHLPLGLTSYRYVQDADRLRLVRANPSASRMLGFDVEARVGDWMDDIFPNAEGSERPNQYRTVALGGPAFRATRREYDDDRVAGVYDSVAFCSGPSEVTVLFEDVSSRIRLEGAEAKVRPDLDHTHEELVATEVELRRRQAELLTLERRHRLARDVARIGVFDYDAKSGQVAWDERYRDLYGVDDDFEPSLEGWLALIHPEDRATQEKLLQEITKGRNDYRTQHRVRGPDGAVRHLRGVAHVERDLDGAVERIVGLNMDITAEATQLAELERANAALERFAYVVTHDLKTPLRGVQLAVRWLRESLGGELAEDVEENLGFIETRARRLTAMVEGILHYSQVQRTPPKPRLFSSRSAVQLAVEDLPVPDEARIDLSGDFPKISVDETMFTQVIRNLVDNALRWAGPSPHVGVNVSPHPIGWQFSVSDNGPGIAPEARERVFELMVTLQSRDKVESTGVGLAICQDSVTRWGGAIGVADSPLGGASVWFTVPRR